YETVIESAVSYIKDKEGSKFLPTFAAELKKSFTTVFDLLDPKVKDNRLARAHAGMMLPALAGLQQEDLADLLADLVKNGRADDPVPFFAVRALREFYKAKPITDNDPPEKKDRDRKRVEAVVKYLDKLAAQAPASDTHENEAVCYLRREAIRALAQTRVP